jgi:hypothetical protein
MWQPKFVMYDMPIFNLPVPFKFIKLYALLIRALNSRTTAVPYGQPLLPLATGRFPQEQIKRSTL